MLIVGFYECRQRVGIFGRLTPFPPECRRMHTKGHAPQPQPTGPRHGKEHHDILFYAFNPDGRRFVRTTQIHERRRERTASGDTAPRTHLIWLKNTKFRIFSLLLHCKINVRFYVQEWNVRISYNMFEHHVEKELTSDGSYILSTYPDLKSPGSYTFETFVRLFQRG